MKCKWLKKCFIFILDTFVSVEGPQISAGLWDGGSDTVYQRSVSCKIRSIIASDAPARQHFPIK